MEVRSDVRAAVQNPNGLSVADLEEHVRAKGSPAGFAGAAAIDHDALLELPCDVLVPAAASGQITAANADRIQAAIVAEGANGPTTPDADAILEERGTFVLPDILCNAGGVFVSYLEYTQETQQEQMREADVLQRLTQRMTERFHDVVALARADNLSMRDASMVLGVRRVCEAVKARGALP